MPSSAEKVKELLDIVDVVGEYVELRQSGSQHKGLCPFHQEKSPSFVVSSERGRYHCFGCGASGDVFSFVQQLEGLDFKGALELLARRVGIDVRNESARFTEEKDRLLDALETAAQFFESELKRSHEARQYLARRGVSEKSIQAWRIGYAPDDWRGLFEHLSGCGVSEKDMERAGLVKRRERVFDTFRGRVLFPIQDTSGRVIAFSGRLLGQHENAPKYLNSPDTPLFNKSEVLYGLNRASSSIRKAGYTILVEGQFDLVLSHQVGVRQTVASSGTAITGHHLSRLKRISPNLILAFDSDEAGARSVYRTAATGLTLGMNVKVARLPQGSDPADCIEQGVTAWTASLKGALPVIEYALENVLAKQTDGRLQLQGIRDDVFPLLVLLSSDMERSYYVSMVADRTEFSVSDVQADLDRYNIDQAKRSGFPDGPSGGGADTGTPSDPLIASTHGPRSVAVSQALSVLLRWLSVSDDPPCSAKELEQSLEEADPDLAATVTGYDERELPESDMMRAEMQYGSADALTVIRSCNELIFQYKAAVLEEQVADLNNRLRGSGQSGEENESLLKQYQTVTRQLHDLRAAGPTQYIHL